MSVTCAECGEQLLGSVNRCWKCGTEFASLPEASALPPVRRIPPAEVAAVVEAPASTEEESAEESTEGNTEVMETPGLPPVRTAPLAENEEQPPVVENEEGSPAQEAPDTDSGSSANTVVDKPFAAHPIKDGSPFAAANQAPLVAAPARPALKPSYPKNAASVGGAYASLSLGILSLFGSMLLPNFPLGPLLTSVFGLGMGAWGLYSKHRVIAAVGLLLCCIALGIAGFFGAVKLYEMIHGVSPFVTDPGIDETTGQPIPQ